MIKTVEMVILDLVPIGIKGIANKVRNITTDIRIRTIPNLNFHFFFSIFANLRILKRKSFRINEVQSHLLIMRTNNNDLPLA